MHLSNFNRTKIIATIGPATSSYEDILGLIKAGASGIRLNFSHGTHKEYKQYIGWIRKASKELGIPVSIIQDLQGPKIRLGDFEGIVNLTKGQGFSLQFGSDYAEGGHIPTQYDLSKKVKRGERILLNDGKIKSTISSIRGDVVYAVAENAGILIRRRGMNLPDTDFAGDIFTPKDRADLIFGSTLDIDYVALSFVQDAEDISALKNLLRNMNSKVKVIAKIETGAAVENIETIIKECDAVMIARGDLAVETPAESVPIVQRKIIALGRLHAKPTIVATQMLASMTETPEPTRAEVSDVATAVIVGADCVMLSEETAVGKYPLEAVRTMKRIIMYTEANADLDFTPFNEDDHSRQASISKAIISLAANIEAKAIVAETKSGATALQIAVLRSRIPLIAVASDNRVGQQLAIVYGVKSYIRPVDARAVSKLTEWLRKLKILNVGDILVTASGHHPGVVGTTDTIKVRMLE